MAARALGWFIALCTAVVPLVHAAQAQPAKEWPVVLLIDDFEAGLTHWQNEDAGRLELVDDAPQGKKALRWTAADEGRENEEV